MAEYKSHPLMEVSEEQIKTIRASNGLENLDKLNQDIDAVLEWFAKESHLPDIKLDRRAIEITYVNRKCSLEQTKKKIDMLFTMKSLMPTYFSPRDPLGPSIQLAFENVYCFPLPKLLPDNTRAIFISVRCKDASNYRPIEIAKLINLMNEYRMYHDYAAGDRIMCDMKLSSYAHFTNWTPTIVKNLLTLIKECFGSRVSSFHLFNSSSFVSQVASLLKACMTAKMGERLNVHSSLDDLFKMIPKSVMPKDYGGDAPSLEELADAWLKEYTNEENRKFILETETWKSNEEKRIGGKKTTEMFGLEGSFRKLDVF